MFGSKDMPADAKALRAALVAQRVAAESALARLDALSLSDLGDGGSEDPALRALAAEVHAELASFAATWLEASGGDASSAAPAPAPSDAPAANAPRKMMGVGPMIGGLSIGELRANIGHRNRAGGHDDDGDGEGTSPSAPGVTTGPVTAPVAPSGGGTPQWMVELAAKKKAKADAERRRELGELVDNSYVER